MFAWLNFRFSRMLAGLLLGLLLVAAVATWFIASGPAPRATGQAPPTRAGAALPARRTVSLQTPPLTGRFAVGTMSLQLTDRSRRDPSSPSGVRELMVQFWYPAQLTRGHAVAPYVPAKVARLAERYYRIRDHLVERLRTRAYTDAPITPGRHAVLLYSPGLADMRSDDTALEENLASDGFVVVAIDHTHEAQWVQFPDGRIVRWSVPYTSSSPNGSSPAVCRRRVKDLLFVVGELSMLDRGNPVLRGALDLARVGAFGFSLGGSTAANAMKTDPRIRAGADLDGAIHDPVLGSGLSRPFMIMLDQGAFAYFRPFVRRLTGPYLVLQLDGSRHEAFTDTVWLSALVRQVAPRLAATLAPGSVNATAAVGAESAYLDAFFETYLDGRPSSLLVGQARMHPVVKVVARRG
ncbi:MAG: alpha/beta hydrolase family protein [Streptosporangiaceae bacterium]